MLRLLFLVLFVLLGACAAPPAAPTPLPTPIAAPRTLPAVRNDDYLQYSGSIVPGGSATHQIEGAQGQLLVLSLASPADQARFAVTGVNDTVALLDAAAGATAWSTTLPTTQLYDITVTSANSAASIPYLLTIMRPESINFGPGAVAAEVQGDLGGDDVDAFVIGAQGGQPLSVTIAPAETNATLQIYGVRDRALLLPGGMRRANWSGILPGDQEYLIEVSAAEPTSYALQVRVEAGAALAPVEAPAVASEASADAVRVDAGGAVQPVVFAAGANRARIEAMSDRAATYQFYGQAGQLLILALESSVEGVRFALSGLADGIAIVEPAQPVHTWAGMLHAAQEYRVDVIVPADQPAAPYTLHVLLPERIELAGGGSAQRTGALDATASTSYVVGVEAGRTLSVAADGPGVLRIAALSGQVLLAPEAGVRSFSGTAPGTEDYLIELIPQGAGDYTLTVETR